ncbi:hypothetical protein VOLCADRAFT_98630 [Volvox carteri f. nagariensis]|uniref:Uncharacterized protein ucp3 n=1 Tax=Volvox carteri f. nagariensis TaxID=3068 RepID=D8UFV4_VOLCA|nr:uncharacterized protein VOLCADRAFT_98630 [Volvox carteri f. nagariensis]EFJ41445.1 hypothetical protein VOLCADRAFT_98630 [Volvox carteri f. nagariensis]|eukprot:XP_002957551.1 hypothetical protein VOLCADRAFT_98630 [Volvox carteri f. nagariensis]
MSKEGSSATKAALKLGLTCSAAMVAEAVTYPIDVVKTRLQLQPYGAVRIAMELVRREGLRGLYAGLSPALIRHVFYTGTRITVYEWLRSAGTSSSCLASKLFMGLTAGAVGQAVAVPADLVKVRLQAEGRLVTAGKLAAPRYKGLTDCFRQIVATDGLAGLWRGGGPAVQRAALVNLGELATYDQAKQAILATNLTGGDNLAAHTASSVCSGFFASVVSVPADVVKTRMMTQDSAAPRYRSSLDCLVKSVRAEGLMALYKGFLPTWARLGPWQLVFWTSYEQMRRTCNLGGF